MASRAIGRTACRVQRHNEHILGVISDTHGIVRSEALEALAGVEQILLAVDPAATGVFAVIAGHSHRPVVEERGGVLFFNPGSAGPRRFKLPVAVGKLYVTPVGVRGEIVRLG
jgi:predicted phosphodiesterase